MKSLIFNLLLLFYLVSFSQSPIIHNLCNINDWVWIGNVYTKPKNESDCHGWITKETIENKPCLPNNPWHLVFEDEFNGTQLDRSKWKSYNVCTGDVYNTENNLAFTGGTMKMQFKQQSGTAYCYDGTSQNFDFTSGGIQTHTKFRHGFYEIKCKPPTGVGVNPSFWLYGDCAQEVDLFELMRTETSLHGNWIHSNLHRKLNCSGNNGTCEFGYWNYFISSYTDGNYHTFGFEWDDYRIRLFVDGCLTRQDYFAYRRKNHGSYNPNAGYRKPVKNCGDLDKKDDKYWVYKAFPTHTMRVILTLQKLQDDPSNNYQEFEIDYVRIWQKQNCDENIKICEWNDYHRYYNYNYLTSLPTYTHHDPVIAKTITFECGNSGSCNYQMDLNYYHESSRSYYATDMIDILPGFDTGLPPGHGGSDAISPRFDAGIRPCPLAVPGKTDDEEYYSDNEDTENLPEIETEEMQETPNQTLTDNSLNDLLVYPNPSTGEVYIHIPNTHNNPFTLTLINTQMQPIKVLESGTVQNQHIYNLQDLPAGMYFVQFSSSSHKITKKLIKL